MIRDPWQLSTFALSAALLFAVGGHFITEAEARPVPIVSKRPPAGGPSRESEKAAPPHERAVRLFEAARKTLSKSPSDPAGHRDKALKFIEEAIKEAKSIDPKAPSVTEDGSQPGPK